MKVEDSTVRQSLLSTDSQASLAEPQLYKAEPRKINGSSFFEHTLFTWVYSMLRCGSKRPITP